MPTYKPQPGTYYEYYGTYISLTDDLPPVQLLEESMEKMLTFYRAVPAEKWDYRYAAGKWSIREVLAHVTDSERVFQYRALCISRGDTTPLPGFDENSYADMSGASQRTVDSLLEEYRLVRMSGIALFRSLNEEQWKSTGTANGNITGPLPLAFIIAGHEIHHSRVVAERYLGQ